MPLDPFHHKGPEPAQLGDKLPAAVLNTATEGIFSAADSLQCACLPYFSPEAVPDTSC